MAILLKLTDGRFLEYSTISDSPNTLSMSEAELRVWYRDEYGRKAYEHEFEERLARTKANGHSGRGKETAESAIICDRSGPDETPLTLEQITEKYRPAVDDIALMRTRRLAQAARVLLECDELGQRSQVYDACENRCKVYKFDAVLSALAKEG